MMEVTDLTNSSFSLFGNCRLSYMRSWFLELVGKLKISTGTDRHNLQIGGVIMMKKLGNANELKMKG